MNRSLLIVALLLTSTVQAYQLKQDSTGNTVRWTETVAFTVNPNINGALGDPKAMDAVQAAVDSFGDTVPQLAVTLTVGKNSALGFDRSGGENQNSIVVLSDWPFDSSFIAATVLTIDSRTHRILDADIALNAQHRKFKVVGAKGERGFDDIQNTLTHELGHALGLAHNPDLEHAVMFPSALPGEIQKRALTADDREGLTVLYSGLVATSPEEATAGCSASGSTRPGFTVFAVLFFGLIQLLARRPGAKGSTARTVRTVATMAVLASSTVFASEVREPAPLSNARFVFTAEVRTVRTRPTAAGATLMYSEVELSVRGCLKGACPDKVTVVVPGGRVGDIEQVVMGRPLPVAGDLMGVSVEPAPAAASSNTVAALSGVTGLATSGATRSGGSALYRLSEPEELQAFASGVVKSGLKIELKDLKPASMQAR